MHAILLPKSFGLCNRKFLMAVQLYLLNDCSNRQRQNRPRIFRDRSSPLDSLDDVDLIARYRLPRHCIAELCDLLNDLERPTKRTQSMSVATQVLTALRFYATGSFQKDAGDLHGISQASVSRCVSAVSSSLCNVASHYISFPDQLAQQRIMAAFNNIANFPNVLGCVDGTQIPITAPHTSEHLFVCRKGFHALNVQVVCDHQLRFTNIVAKWPGSAHDSFVWSNSGIYHQLKQRPPDELGWLLGDSGYPLSHFLLTPIQKPDTPPEESYNQAHRRTRNTVERAIGVWKMRFRCLHKTGGCLQSPPVTCVKIITACAVLHNICIINGIPDNGSDVGETENEDDREETGSQCTDQTGSDRDNGRRVRSRLIEQRFRREH